MAKWLELLKAGTWKDRLGTVRTVTKETLQRIHENYKPDSKPAHILVGHPDKPTVPSFGIVDGLKLVGDTLMFRPGKVVAEFAALVGKGAFPGVSAGLDPQMEHLDHIAFLSAERPAVDGLKPVLEFSAPADTESIVSIDISERFDKAEFSSSDYWFKWRIKDISSVLRSLKNFLIEKYDADTAEKIAPEYLLTDLAGDPPAPVEETGPQFSASQGGQMNFEQLYNELLAKHNALVAEHEPQSAKLAEFSTQVSTIAAENETLKAQNTELLGKIATFEAQVRSAQFSAFVETLIASRKVKPDEKQSIVDKLEQMHAVTPVEFSAEGGKKSPLDIYKEELETRTVCVPPTGETAERGPEFSAGAPDPVEIGKRAQKYQDEMKAKGVSVDTIAAVKHVRENG